MGIGLSLRQAQASGDQPAEGAPCAIDSENMQDQLARIMQLQLEQGADKTGQSPMSPNTQALIMAGMSSSGPRSSDVVKDILNDDFFSARNPSTPGATPGLVGGNGAASSRPTSRRTSNAGDIALVSPAVASPNDNISVVAPDEFANGLAKKDPLAAQVWKAYAKAKGGLLNGPRMENLTWRMMHMTLKKPDGTPIGPVGMDLVKEEDESAAEAEEAADKPGAMTGEEEERGRRGRFKGKGRVVGFDAESPQGQQNE
jgi:GATA-binding protein